MAKRTMSRADWRALDLFLAGVAPDVVAILVDHGPQCPLRLAAQRLMAVAGWTEEDLARAYFREVQL